MHKFVILVVVGWLFLFSNSSTVVSVESPVVTTEVASPTPTPTPTPTPGVENSNVIEETDGAEVAKTELPTVPPEIGWMWERNNQHRAENGRSPQQLDARLCRAAQDHATYLAKTGQFDHYVNGNPRTRAAKYGFPVRDLGSLEIRENIAGDFQTVTNAFLGWKGSPGHWENLLSDCTLCGFGYDSGVFGRVYVAVYGRAETAHGVQVLAESPQKESQVVCTKDGVCTFSQASAPQIPAGRWVVENVPVYGRFGAFRGYSQQRRWQGPSRAAAAYSGSCSSCR